MSDLPVPIRDFIEALTEDTLSPAYLFVKDGAGLSEWGGDLSSYGILGLEKHMDVSEHIPYLSGLLPLETGNLSLPRVQTRTGVFADIYLFRRDEGVWFLLLDVTSEARRRRRLQQRANEASLEATDLKQEGEALARVNSLLEERVRERTAQLSQTVLQLEHELAEKERAQDALRESQMRFLSLYDANIIGITFWESSGKLTEANSEFLDLVGYSREDLVAGRMHWDQISGATNSSAEPDLSAELRNTLSLRPSLRPFVRKDGSSVTLLFSAAPQKGTRDKMVCFALDLSKYQ
ncbi:MAG: PAS domain S-box protein [Pyrinomonadaceae bacterium]